MPQESDNQGNIIAPEPSKAEGQATSYILVGALAKALMSCSSSVNGASVGSVDNFESLSVNERETVTDWLAGTDLPSDNVEAQGDEVTRLAEARELDYRRLTPIDPVPYVSTTSDGEKLSAFYYRFECTFSPEGFWHKTGSIATFSFPAINGQFESENDDQAEHSLIRDLNFVHNVGGQYEFKASTFEPTSRNSGQLSFSSWDTESAGATVRLAPFDVAFSDLRQQKLEAAMLFASGILAGILSNIVVGWFTVKTRGE